MRKSGKGAARIPELDGLRVLMIFIVSWYHIWQQSWLTPRVGQTSLDFLVRSGYVWVDGTVLLSAFLLFLPWARAGRDGTGLPAADSFWFRRAKRILPAYVFIILLTLFAVVLPWGLYSSPQYMVKDLATHLTFTFPFFYDTYVATPLGAAAWTVAIEVQAYLLFPLIARGAVRKPVLTLGTMLALCFGFRAWCLWSLTEYNMVVNQLIDFLDVYVIGILAAMAFVRLEDREKAVRSRKTAILRASVATAVFLAAAFALVRLLRVQAGSDGYAAIQSNQMKYRPLFALCFAAVTLSCHFAAPPVRWLLGNPVMKFLAGVSMNYYLVHQTLAVHLKRLGIPESLSEAPHMEGERAWQVRYTYLAFGLSLALAILITYLVEKPAARLLEKAAERKKNESKEVSES